MDTQFDIKQIVDGEGQLVDETYSNQLTSELVTEFYKQMFFVRLFDRKSVNLQRQGRLGTYVPFEGQEAAQVGSALALSDGDWMFPTYRDHGATLTFGHSMKNVFTYWNGLAEGCVPPKGKNIFPPAVPIASQLLHATGAAWAEKKKGTDRVAIVYFGDGATSEGDFHEALNFATVFQTPTVFFNQNNGFAISVPMNKQMHSKTIAQKALAYDMEGVRIDGNDVFVTYFETLRAVEKARREKRPTLIEAVTWRYGAHTTADDPTKYRDQSETEIRRKTTDPLLRVEKYMKANNMWNEEEMLQFEKETLTHIEEAVKAMENEPKADVNHLFDYVFETAPWPIVEQKQTFFQSAKGGSL